METEGRKMKTGECWSFLQNESINQLVIRVGKVDCFTSYSLGKVVTQSC